MKAKRMIWNENEGKGWIELDCGLRIEVAESFVDDLVEIFEQWEVDKIA